MCGYKWDYFPARLHTTKEIIHFLENIDNIKQIIDDNPSDLTDFIFGDIYHKSVKPNSNKFINKNINKNIDKIIFEICSRKIMYYNDIPLNNYYLTIRGKDKINKYNITEKILTDEDIENDIKYIIKICKQIFNENIDIHIIPHLNLKTKVSNEYIQGRNELVILLEDLSNKYNLKIHNIGKFIENNNDNCFLEDYMSDSTYYSAYGREIKQFLITEIIDK